MASGVSWQWPVQQRPPGGETNRRASTTFLQRIRSCSSDGRLGPPFHYFLPGRLNSEYRPLSRGSRQVTGSKQISDIHTRDTAAEHTWHSSRHLAHVPWGDYFFCHSQDRKSTRLNSSHVKISY